MCKVSHDYIKPRITNLLNWQNIWNKNFSDKTLYVKVK